jgi:hypothetical protein
MNGVAANRPARGSSCSQETTGEPDGTQSFIDDVGRVVSRTDDDHEITKRVAERCPTCWPTATGFRWRSLGRRPSAP